MNLTTPCFMEPSLARPSRRVGAEIKGRTGVSYRRPFVAAARLKTASTAVVIQNEALSPSSDRLSHWMDRLDRAIPALSISVAVAVIICIPDRILSALAELGNVWMSR